jgi:hypothetical protein
VTVRSWKLAGTYLEACNCEAICPCRAINGRRGGRSTYGECLGALSWAIEEGDAGGVDLGGLGVVLALRYHDDEPGSPWTFVLYLDERASPEQAEALEAIFTGAVGGTPITQFPWAFKASDLIAVRMVPIEVEHTPRRGWFRAGSHVTVRVGDPLAEQPAVTCVIPGHHQPGEEFTSELIEVEDGPLAFQFSDRCGYRARFEYSSEQD